ncbi:FimV/HubP family polar landmark protein [Halomonas daqiaonensis]|uniref:FimV N-terminal domain-containing protein n=1 Tax=Halomonas daqiaonensis TaxID=650850 RepID=A0A1H7HHT1_9GAMM|nr:FimV/HubP family polar landmark protein [Halomonas daqiaonensis]SEK47785.1 FimV N-terminal domain-containing protein [Halomonas daqiaonensis]
MKRKLTFAMLLSLSAASPLVLALGLGEPEVNSTLNAPLRASIPLTDTSGLEADLINVSVAGERAFSSAGLPRTPLAASVRMDVTRRQGRLVVDLTTERAVREPWIDLLLRFDWPGGQQLREVTLLLDPPDYDQLPALVPSSTSSRDVASSPSSSSPASEPATRPVARTSSNDSGDPARVRNGDTLWAVAGRLRPDSGISRNQMMVALVEANPEVFPSGNINSMRAGFTLVVPPRDAITTRSPAEAERIVQAMNQAWANRGSGAPARVALGGSSDTTASAVASAPAQEGASPESTDQVQPEAVETASSVASDDGDNVSGEGEQRLTLLSDAELAAEGGTPVEGESAQQEDDETAGAPQGEEIADTSLALPSGAEGAEGEGPFIDPEVLALLQGSGGLTDDQRLLRLEARWRENRQALEAVRSERDELQSQLGNLREELDAMRDQLAALSAGGQGADAAGSGGVVAPGSEPESTQQASWWGALYQGDTGRNLLLGGAGLAALLALWALIRRRRREESEPPAVFDEVRAVNPATDGVVVPGTSQARSAEVQSQERAAPVRTSMPEAEAINEADIFIAYGRHDQARELLESSLAQEPSREDLRLKLLGVQLKQGDHAAAARQAELLRAGGDPDVRAQVAQLMERHAHSAPSAQGAETTSDMPDERAVFPEADELPPRRFDDPDASDGAQADDEPVTDEASPRESSEDISATPAESEGASADTSSEPEKESSAGERDDPLARYRPPELEPEPNAQEGDVSQLEAVAAFDQDGEPARENERTEEASLESFGVTQEHGAPEKGGELEEPGEHEMPSEPEQPETAEEFSTASLSTRQADDGREVIDYNPPTLEEHYAPREETPMQPSVEFTPSGAGDGDTADTVAGSKSESDVSEEWDIEEVAFPPLSQDNANFSAAASASSSLAEARRLLDAGAAAQARALLESLIDESDDPDARQEARELLDQSQP